MEASGPPTWLHGNVRCLCNRYFARQILERCYAPFLPQRHVLAYHTRDGHQESADAVGLARLTNR